MQKLNWKLLILSAVLAITAIFQVRPSSFFFFLFSIQNFKMGYTNAYPNTAIGSFRIFLNESANEPYTLSNSEFEWAWSAMLAIYFIGFAAGSVISAGVADRIGRKCELYYL